MRVFISWSGQRSHEIALALRDWLPTVLPGVEPWVSSEDIDKGARWTAELGRELDAARFGVICLVPENLGKDWVIFEAGAIARSFETARVAPLPVGVEVNDIAEPLRQFQCTVFEKEDVRRLVRSINRAMGGPVDPQGLDEVFDQRWLDLAARVQAVVPAPQVASPATRVAARKEAAAPQGEPPLPEEQSRVLRALAQSVGRQIMADLIPHAIGQNPVRTEHHLDELVARGFINYIFVAGRRTYVLTPGGRAYIVAHNLDAG